MPNMPRRSSCDHSEAQLRWLHWLHCARIVLTCLKSNKQRSFSLCHSQSYWLFLIRISAVHCNYTVIPTIPMKPISAHPINQQGALENPHWPMTKGQVGTASQDPRLITNPLVFHWFSRFWLHKNCDPIYSPLQPHKIPVIISDPSHMMSSLRSFLADGLIPFKLSGLKMVSLPRKLNRLQITNQR